METFRTMLACILRQRRRHDGYTELIYDDDKMAGVYSDYDNEGYSTQHEVMSYYYDADARPISDGDDNYDGATAFNEKAGFDTGDTDARSVEEVARDVARLLWRAEWNDDALQGAISDCVGEQRAWNRKMVEACLDGVIDYVEQGRRLMGDAMCAALDTATDVADEAFAFPRRHPPSLDGFIAIVSVGVLAQLQGAWVLELLGFGEVRGKEGMMNGDREVAMLTSDKIVFWEEPKPGSFAAWWAREYADYIPGGSVYSYLRQLGMIEIED
ncbi:uncharacterized protein B0T15DRAFT_85639 [Chaetomium strumarium]|uniref:Uncharacterized protein n=1 Tax=Chaetomium strumarium TaxID=1170767 RepID=A0AAJ0GX77_9PEZI|nr:hypothetical protein B0T15DRAFT_85639 [Chaetomium strumarium]